MHATSVSLIALALGYKVFVDAGKEKEGLKILGQTIGVLVMVAALLVTLGGAMKCVSRAACPMMSKACPMTDKADAYSDSGK